MTIKNGIVHAIVNNQNRIAPIHDHIFHLEKLVLLEPLRKGQHLVSISFLLHKKQYSSWIGH